MSVHSEINPTFRRIKHFLYQGYKQTVNDTFGNSGS